MIYEREQITLEIRSFIESLNHECKAGAVVVVEGKKDGIALREVGFNGEILVYNNFKGIINLVDYLSRKGKKRTYFEKFIEIILATRLEFRHSKNKLNQRF